MNPTGTASIDAFKSDDPFVFQAPTTGAVAVGSLDNPSSSQKFRKELIKVGRYVKGDQRFEVSQALLQHWESTFRSMRDAGVKVPVPVDHSMSAKDTMGDVVDMFVEGSSLFGILEMRGKDAINMAQRNDVSIYSPPDWKDGKGNKYTRPILHVALTPYPVVTGLRPFEAISASLETTIMKDWSKVREAFSINDEVTDDTAETLLLAAAKTKNDALAAMQAKLDDMKKKLEEAMKMSNPPVKREIDPTLLKLAGENRTMKIRRLAEGSSPAISPAVAKDLEGLFASDDGLTLSLSSEFDVFDRLMDALSKNSAMLGQRERTGPQLLELSRNSDTVKNSSLVKNAEAAAGQKTNW